MPPVLPTPEKTSHPVDVGLRTEGAILSKLIRRGHCVFLVFCPETERVYAVPAEDVPARGMHLRVDPPRNQQSKRVRWAHEYELPA